MRGSAISSLGRAVHGDAAGFEDVAAVGDLERVRVARTGNAGRPERETILADPAETLAERAAAALRRAGFSTSTPPPDEGDVAEVIARRVAAAEALRSGEAIAIGCEPVLSLPEKRGAGGRAGYVALAVLHRLPRGVVFLAGASDGVDGSSGTAGAVVAAEDAERVTADDVACALTGFDDARIHRALGTALEGGGHGNEPRQSPHPRPPLNDARRPALSYQQQRNPVEAPISILPATEGTSQRSSVGPIDAGLSAVIRAASPRTARLRGIVLAAVLPLLGVPAHVEEPGSSAFASRAGSDVEALSRARIANGHVVFVPIRVRPFAVLRAREIPRHSPSDPGR